MKKYTKAQCNKRIREIDEDIDYVVQQFKASEIDYKTLMRNVAVLEEMQEKWEARKGGLN